VNSLTMIKLFYSFLTVFVLIAVNVTTMSILDVLPALFLMWLFFAAFYFGFYSKKKMNYEPAKPSNSRFLFERKKVFVGVIVIIFSLSIIRFYTGQTFVSVIKNLVNGNSPYLLYQQYFVVHNLGALTLEKIPFSLMLFAIKLVLIYSFAALLLVKNKTTMGEKLFLVVVSAAYLFFGLARGTNFEFFEFCILIAFIILTRATKGGKRSISLRTTIIVGVVAIIGIVVFSIIISYRGNFGYYITSDIGYDSDTIISKLLPTFSLLLSGLTMYFGFGFYYISTYFYNVWLHNIFYTMAGFLPMGYKLFGIDSITNEVNRYTDPGTNWHPDTLLFIQYFGVFGLLILCFIAGRFLKKLDNNCTSRKDYLTYMINYVIMLQMISLPIGNFVIVSSANKLLVFLLFCILMKRMLVWKKINSSIEKEDFNI